MTILSSQELAASTNIHPFGIGGRVGSVESNPPQVNSPLGVWRSAAPPVDFSSPLLRAISRTMSPPTKPYPGSHHQSHHLFAPPGNFIKSVAFSPSEPLPRSQANVGPNSPLQPAVLARGSQGCMITDFGQPHCSVVPFTSPSVPTRQIFQAPSPGHPSPPCVVAPLHSRIATPLSTSPLLLKASDLQGHDICIQAPSTAQPQVQGNEPVAVPAHSSVADDDNSAEAALGGEASCQPESSTSPRLTNASDAGVCGSAILRVPSSASAATEETCVVQSPQGPAGVAENSEQLRQCAQAPTGPSAAWTRAKITLGAARLQLLADQRQLVSPEQSANIVQCIASTLASDVTYRDACGWIFEKLKELIISPDGTTIEELPTSKFPEVLAAWDIPDRHLPLFWAMLRKTDDYWDKPGLASSIPYSVFESIFAKVLRRVRDRHSGQKITREQFVHKNLRDLQDDYHHSHDVGEGSFGRCVWMEHRGTKKPYICKIIRKDPSIPIEEIYAELDVMKQLDHPNVLRVFEWLETDTEFAFVLEVAHGGDLKGQLALAREQGSSGLDEMCVQLVTMQSLRALMYIHSHRIIHRDVKPANLLLAQKIPVPGTEEDTRKLRVLVADFGVAELSHGQDKSSAALKGTLPYMALEVLAGEVGPRSDVWALGVSVQELLCAKRPYGAETAMAFYAMLRMHPPKVESIQEAGASQGAEDFVRSVLIKDEASRPNASDALSHAWLQIADSTKSTLRTEGRKLRRGLTRYATRSAFSKTVANCIAAHVDSSQVEQVTEIFIALDENHDGVLNKDELKMGLMKAGVDKSKIDGLVDSADVDHDGRVNYTEFVASLLTTQGGLEDSMLEKAFEVFDADQSGGIDAQEMCKMLGSDHADAILPDGTTVKALVRAMDKEGNGKVSKADFQTFMRESNLQSQCGDDQQLLHQPSGLKLSRQCTYSQWRAAGGTPNESTTFHSLPTSPTVTRPHQAWAISSETSLRSVFAQIATELFLAPRPADVDDLAIPDYEGLCSSHARRLGREHWLFTVGDLRLLSASEWSTLDLPLKLRALLRAAVQESEASSCAVGDELDVPRAANVAFSASKVPGRMPPH